MSGLQLIQKAKSICPDFFSILLSGEYHKNNGSMMDERFLQYIDKYIIKGMDDMNELMDALNENSPS
jgi:hypothetical protein